MPVPLTDPDQSAFPDISLQHALNAAQLGTWQCDAHRRVFSWDARCREILGASANVVTAEDFMNWVHPDDAGSVRAAFSASLDLAEPRLYGNEFRIIRRGDGEVRWVEVLGRLYLKGEGRGRRAINLVGTIADITERKEREEKLYLLMREVNHRARNMLGVVDAIARQTVREDYVERFSERIGALAAYQDLLVRSEWQGVEIGDLTRVQLSRFADLIGSRIAVEGPKLRLNPASAQAIGLALHELGTNAGKHGALSTDAGRVDVSWGIDGDTLTINWAERDGPPVSRPKRHGFGSIVMKTMAERSLAGVVRLDYALSGLILVLDLPCGKRA
jgi:PAS domain S-box-containing protein